MNPEQLFTHLKKLAQSLSAKQILGLVGVFVAVVAVVVSSAYWMSTPDYALLVADMDSETASSVVPYASVRRSALLTRSPPNRRPVVPESPFRV